MSLVELKRPDKHQKDLLISWTLGSVCNFSCSYCPDNLHDGKVKFPDLEDAKSFFCMVKEQRGDYRIFVELLGGEPTYWKHLQEFIDFCKENDIFLDIITNGFRSKEWWDDVSRKIQSVNFSFHAESMSQQHYFDIVPMVSERIPTAVSIMMMPQRFDELVHFANHLHKMSPNANILLKPLRHDLARDFYQYTENQKKTMSKVLISMSTNRIETSYVSKMIGVFEDGATKKFNASQLSLKGLNNFYGWTCYGGVERLIIDKNQTIHAANCSLAPIAKLGDSNIWLPAGPQLCPHSSCVCAWDIYTTKKRVAPSEQSKMSWFEAK